MKTLTIRQYAAIKRVAQNVNPLVVKKNKIAAKIEQLNEEYAALNKEIEGHEAGVKSFTGGLVSEDLIIKVIVDTGKLDKEGKPIKATKYLPKENILVFNADTNLYEIHADFAAPAVETVDNPDIEYPEESEVKETESESESINFQ